MWQLWRQVSKSYRYISLGVLALGIFFAALSGSWWMDYWASGNWQRVGVTIESNQLISSRRDSDDARSYRNEVEYRYQFQGQEYSGYRVGLESGGSSGSYHRRRYQILQEHLRSGEEYLAWVNPANPQQAVLFRESSMTMWAVTVVAFGLLVGAMGLLAQGVIESRPPLRPYLPVSQAEGFWPSGVAHGQPWLAQGLKELSIATGAACFCAVFAVILLSEDEWGAAAYWGSIALLGLAALILSGGANALWSFYQRSTLRMAFDTIPLRPGRTLRALLISRRPFPYSHIACRLHCWRSDLALQQVEGASEEKRVSTTLYNKNWSVNIAQGGEPHAHGFVVPISHDIPEELPGRKFQGSPLIRWRLTIQARHAGRKIEESFEVPIFTNDD